MRAGWLRVAVLRALRRPDALIRRYPFHAIPLAPLDTRAAAIGSASAASVV